MSIENPDSNKTIEIQFKLAYEALEMFQTNLKINYGKLPYNEFEKSYDTYADLVDNLSLIDSKLENTRWTGEPPEKGTYVLEDARTIHYSSLIKMEEGKTIMERMYGKEPFGNFMKVLHQYPLERQDVRRFRAYILREEGKIKQIPLQK
jgi:hypothetical protein